MIKKRYNNNIIRVKTSKGLNAKIIIHKKDPRFLFPIIPVIYVILLFLFLRPFECSLLLVSNDVSSVIRQLGESIKTDRFSFPSFSLHVSVCLESMHMYRMYLRSTIFSRFFCATFDYPRLSLCHVKNYIRYIFLLGCDDHLKTQGMARNSHPNLLVYFNFFRGLFIINLV